jgi:hypothetical protein
MAEPTREQREAEQERLGAERDAIIKSAMTAVAEALPRGTPLLKEYFHYGATGIGPEHLAMWYMFAANADLARAKASGVTARMAQATRAELAARGYPADVAARLAVSFTTDEDARGSGLNFYEYFNDNRPIWHRET